MLPPHSGPFASFSHVSNTLSPLPSFVLHLSLHKIPLRESFLHHLDQISFFYYIFPLSCLKTFLKCLIEYLCIYYYEFPYVTISSMKPETNIFPYHLLKIQNKMSNICKALMNEYILPHFDHSEATCKDISLKSLYFLINYF